MSSLPPLNPSTNDGAATTPLPPALTILNAVIQKVDVEANTLGAPHYETSAEDIRVYVVNLLRELIHTPRSQTYKFSAEVCEVKDQIERLLTDNFKRAAEILGQRLLNCEVAVQKKMAGFTSLRKGSLFCAHFQLGNKEYVILVKIDHAGFLNEATLQKASGLPEKQRAQKCATFTIVDGVLEPVIVISDSSPAITDYWWNAYLSLVALSSPERNTQAAFTAVEKLLKAKVQSKSPSDYWTLRNAFVGYFTTRAQCVFPDMIDEVIGGYTPDSEEVVISDLVEAAKQLPNKDKGFDTHFTLVPKIISSKIRKQIKLAENVDLRIMGSISNINDLFETGFDGRKFLKIYSDEGYDAFNRKESIDDPS